LGIDATASGLEGYCHDFQADQLRDITMVVADTGGINAAARLTPVGCTTSSSVVPRNGNGNPVEDIRVFARDLATLRAMANGKLQSAAA